MKWLLEIRSQGRNSPRAQTRSQIRRSRSRRGGSDAPVASVAPRAALPLPDAGEAALGWRTLDLGERSGPEALLAGLLVRRPRKRRRGGPEKGRGTEARPSARILHPARLARATGAPQAFAPDPQPKERGEEWAARPLQLQKWIWEAAIAAILVGYPLPPQPRRLFWGSVWVELNVLAGLFWVPGERRLSAAGGNRQRGCRRIASFPPKSRELDPSRSAVFSRSLRLLPQP